MLLKTGNLSTHELYFISRKYAGMSGIKLLKEKKVRKYIVKIRLSLRGLAFLILKFVCYDLRH